MPLAELERRAEAGDIRAQIGLAGRLDQEGRHEDAINWLSRAAQAGDAQALATLGFRLLEGTNAPFMPREGAGLLSDAAARGSAEAAAMISVLAGGGFYGPQSWDVALRFLQRSAELGGASARDQLRLLARNAGLTSLAGSSTPPADIWRRLREDVDVSAWTRPPPARSLNAAPRAWVVEGFAAPEVCDWIIAQARPRLQRALVQDPATGRTIMGKTRTNQIANFGLADTCLVNLLLQAKISAAAEVPVEMLEAFAVLHYGVGEEASEHFDYLDPTLPAYAAVIAQFGQRVATCLLYLNEDFEGGETAFPDVDLAFKGRKGDALFFASVDPMGAPDPRSRHAGRPPTSGEKWVLSQFIRDKPRAGLGATRA
jgi:hypothetical protein